MDKDAGQLFRELKEDVTAFTELKFELLKLTTFERTGKVIAVLSYGVILLFLVLFATLFLFLALGFFIGQSIGSMGAGYIITALIYGIAILILYLNRSRFMLKVQNIIIGSLLTNDDNNDETKHENNADAAGATEG